MINEWGVRNFQPIIDYCKTAEFFQDIPFSRPYTFIACDQAFSNSKFILTVSDSPELWYNSLVKFHSKLWSKDAAPPTIQDLKDAKYVYTGWAYELHKWDSFTNEIDPYNKEILIKSYIDHNNLVLDYFKHRPRDLLVINFSEKFAYRKLCEFLGKPITSEEFPWENKT